MSLKVMLVDDDLTIVSLWKDLFDKDYTCETAQAGNEALTKFYKFKPDIVLLDYLLPDKNGLDLCKEMKKVSFHTKIIMISGIAELEERIKCYQEGADDFILKPFVTQELLAKVHSFAKLRMLEKQMLYWMQDLERQVEIRSEQLLERERSAWLGMNFAQIVHNLKSPLTVLRGYQYMLLQQYPEEPKIQKLSESIEKIEHIISSVLIPQSGEKNTSEWFSLNKIIESLLKMFEANYFFSTKVKVTLDLEEQYILYGQSIHFYQIFQNLIQNSIDAMMQSEEKNLTIYAKYIDYKCYLTLKDSGEGISQENLSKVFDPFFTTRKLNIQENSPSGSGLGLAYVKQMVESYNGNIYIDSILNKGTEITLEIPCKTENFFHQQKDSHHETIIRSL